MRKDIKSTELLPNFDPCMGNGYEKPGIMMTFKNYTKWQVETAYSDEENYQDIILHYE